MEWWDDYLNMPKVVDNYVFERKIGSGQYGDVFKGYNKNNGMDIAIKAIKRIIKKLDASKG